MNLSTQMAIHFYAEMKIESKNYNISILIYKKKKKKKKKKSTCHFSFDFSNHKNGRWSLTLN